MIIYKSSKSHMIVDCASPFRRMYRVFLNIMKQYRKMSTCTRILNQSCPPISPDTVPRYKHSWKDKEKVDRSFNGYFSRLPQFPRTWNMRLPKEIQIKTIATFLILFGAHMNISFILKVKILMFINSHIGHVSSCKSCARGATSPENWPHLGLEGRREKEEKM